MLARFSLYGFLKNQRYFEPFLILAFREKGLSFFQIGALIAFRGICINVTEIPSGTLADLYGRRKSMIVSFSAYILSFAIFGFSRAYWHFFPAMLLFAVGDAFRTGTHKAMIFTWLRMQGRINEKTQVYGYTRSWSKIGSAVSVILASGFVFISKDYTSIFFLSIIPYLFGLINFMGYPKELDGAPVDRVSMRGAISHFLRTTRQAIRIQPLRRLILESMGFEGMFAVAQDYLQPILKTIALAFPFCLALADEQRGAILVGVIYFLLYIGSAAASRNAHQLVSRLGGEEKSARFLWKINLALYLVLIPLLYYEIYSLAVAAFMILFLMQNLWRPILISRFDEHASETQGATVLSIESQAKSFSTILLAPLLGRSVDFLSHLHKSGVYAHGVFWPVGLFGLLLAGAILLTGKHPQKQTV